MIEKYLIDFNIITLSDLSEITKTPSAIYKLFKQHHRKQFSNNDRLIFYTSHHIPEQLWRHLYQAANLIDISNYFILICHPQSLDIQSSMYAQEWSLDPVPFQTMIVSMPESAPLENNYHVPDSICPLPWMHLEIRNDGKIAPCCLANNIIGQIKDIGVAGAFYGNDMINLRESFLKGERPSTCSACWQHESLNLPSDRQRHLKLSRYQLLTQYLDDPVVASLDIKPGNTCNFKCRICNPSASSLWANEAAAWNQKMLPISIHNWAEDTDFIFQDIIKQVPNLINIDMYGGEPFLIKNLKKLVEQIVINNSAKHVKLHYNSNGSIWPKDLLPLWEHFQHVDLYFSIDNINQRFELERGGSWQEVSDNIKRLKEMQLDNVKINIMPVVSIMNVFYLDELFDWAMSLELPVDLLYLQKPLEFSLEKLTPAAIELILKKYQNNQHPEIKKITELIQQIPGSDGSEFVKYTKYFDTVRRQSFIDTHKEIAIAMGCVYNTTSP
jgi:MoaA/NifB/PqqE/SkfB family radical SAM enzyme